MEGRSQALRAHARPGALARVGAVASSFWYAASLAVWAAWVGLVALAIALAEDVGAISDTVPVRWFHHAGFLWPLWSWDFGWYQHIAFDWYPSGQGGREYAFFPLWPWLLAHSGSLQGWQLGGILTLLASALAFLGVVAARPGPRDWRAALVLACWPGSFALLLVYPDGLALAAAAWAAALALRGWPEVAAVLGAVAAFARPNGFLIAVPFVFLALRRGPRYWLAAAAPVATVVGVHAYFWSRSGVWNAFFRAQTLWVRNGPTHFGTWGERVASGLGRAGLVVLALAVVAAAVVYIAWRVRPIYALGLAYIVVVATLLLGAQSKRGVIDSAVAALVLPACLILWRLGDRYRPWAAFATAVIAVSLLSGSVQSFYRQALFAFPLMWVPLEGPAVLRRGWVLALGLVANLGLVALLTKFPP